MKEDIPCMRLGKTHQRILSYKILCMVLKWTVCGLAFLQEAFFWGEGGNSMVMLILLLFSYLISRGKSRGRGGLLGGCPSSL